MRLSINAASDMPPDRSGTCTMSKPFDVSLAVTSRRFTLAELTARLGRKPSPGSHDKGERRGSSNSNQSWDCNVWRQNPADDSLPLADQCLELLRTMPSACGELRAADPDDFSVSLDIAVFFNTAYFSLVLPHRLIAKAAESHVDLEITGYPSRPSD